VRPGDGRRDGGEAFRRIEIQVRQQRFSMMTFCPSLACSSGAITRASASTGPPATNGTTSLMVWFG
jgi:hypothetical protein